MAAIDETSTTNSAASRSALGASSPCAIQVEVGRSILPAVFTNPQSSTTNRGGANNLYCPITGSFSSIGGTEETLSDVARGSHSAEYKAWIGMKQRCFNPRHPRYQDYGGRGIGVCQQWQNDFTAFIRDMGAKPSRRHTLERINNDGPYSLENCCWATYRQQTRNRRSNVFLTHDDLTLCLNDWAQRLGVGRMTVSQRLRRGWTVSDALSIPVAGRRKR